MPSFLSHYIRNVTITNIFTLIVVYFISLSLLCSQTLLTFQSKFPILFKLILLHSILFTVTPNQIERLYSRFTSLDRGDCGTLSREDFLRIPELAINPLGDRIVNAFFEESGNDRVNFLQFMQVLSHFRPIKKNSPNRLNSRQEKLKCK